MGLENTRGHLYLGMPEGLLRQFQLPDKAKWAETETGRQAKFYSLTAAGRAQLEKEAANWNRLSASINLVVETTWE